MSDHTVSGIGARSGPAHHVHQELLMDYAAGACGEAESLVIATHLAMCPACRGELSKLERVGGALLTDLEPEPMAADSLAAVFSQIDTARPAIEVQRPRRTVKPGHIDVPEPLRSYLDGDLEDLPWRRVMRGLTEYSLQTAGDGFKTRLLRIKGGTPMPRHTHHGNEFTLVLAGGYSDRRGHFVRGDIDINDEEVEHEPVADAGEDCICLTVTQAPLRLTGPIGRLLNPFVKF